MARPASASAVPDHPHPRRTVGALEPTGDRRISRNVRTVFRIWVIVFGLVGAQMSWVLRPLIGSSAQFVLFRPRGDSFFHAVFWHVRSLLGM